MIFDRLLEIAEKAPETSGLNMAGRFTSYADLVRRIERLPAGFAGRGIGHRSVVALLIPNPPDIFAVAHARIRLVHSALVSVNPGLGASHGLNAYFPMPFATGARITVEHRGERPLGGLLPAFWYHIEYEAYDRPPPSDALRFHAQWRQEKPTVAVGPHPNVQLHSGVNLDGADNYVALDAAGAGQMVGLLLQVNNIAGGWVVLKTTGAQPTVANRWAFYEPDGLFYTRGNSSGQVLNRLTPPADWKNGTWTFDTVTVGGVTMPNFTNTAGNSTRHYGTFFYVPALKALAWISGENNPVVLVRPPAVVGTPVPAPAPRHVRVRIRAVACL